MASTVSLEGVKKAVFFPFQGKNWGTKTLIGAALFFGGFLVVPILFVMGYSAKIMERIIHQNEDPELPEWSDWGGLLVDGLKLYGAVFLYQLPALILIVGGYFLAFALNIGFSMATIPLMANSSDPSGLYVLPFFGSIAGTFIGFAVAILGLIFIIVLQIFVPAALGNMIAKGEFSAAFRVKEWWPILKANFSGYLITFLITMGLFSVIYLLFMLMYMTVVLCALLPVVLAGAGFIFGVITYALYAIVYRDGTRKVAGVPTN